ncbi:MAG: hypothetical protein HRU20_14915 [Pseudomonadales bacterium]|nr:hypothetical protein [Pseudomonadales bacterium]
MTEPSWYQDSDGDGFGNAQVHSKAASQPDGYVADNSDCDDADAAKNPGASNCTISSFELLDPIPHAENRLGSVIDILPNGNVILAQFSDSSFEMDNGSFHLVDPYSQSVIASHYGQQAGSGFGEFVTVLNNNNFVISSPSETVGGKFGRGSVRLYNGTTGAQIAIRTGDEEMDLLGVAGVVALANNNFVVASPEDNALGLQDAGIVMLINGNSGAVISLFGGYEENDLIGLNGIKALSNSNYIVSSSRDVIGASASAGSVRLLNGTTGAEIAVYTGDQAGDKVGCCQPVTVLNNDNFVIASSAEIIAGISQAGSVRLIDGATGAQIGPVYVGTHASDQVGSGGITALNNNNFVISSPNEDVGGVVNTGAISLINGTTGMQIGSTLTGPQQNLYWGNGGTVALANNNYVVSNYSDNANGFINSGSVMLMDGSTGTQIGVAITGNADYDRLSYYGGITALANNNFVIASTSDDVAGVTDAGSVMLVNGSSNSMISSIAGDNASDQLGNEGVSALSNSNYIILSSNDDVSGIVDGGSVMTMNGATGVQMSTIEGLHSQDIFYSHVVESKVHGYYIIALPGYDNGGLTDSGRVEVFSTP